jgi:hypothetical protein
MTDWGAHHNDIVLWALGHAGPVKINGKPTVEMIPDGFTAASEYAVEYKYADGVVHRCQSTSANAWNGAVVDAKAQQHGIKFTGADFPEPGIFVDDACVVKQQIGRAV